MSHCKRGMTLVEILVAISILTVGVIGFMGAFKYISKSIHLSRTTTLASNLAQEKVETLKNLSYYKLLISTSSSVDTDFSPGLTYDNSNYPPETISIGGITFTRYTYVALAQIDSDIISTVTYTYPDTGMKQITVHVKWREGAVNKKVYLTNLLENPNVSPLDTSISGTISKTGGGALAGAVVRAEQNPDYNAVSDASGGYSFQVYHGSYTVRASSAGYYDAVSPQVYAARGTPASASLTLTAIGTGTVAGNAWISSNVVISQIVAGTNTVVGDGSTQGVEYVELFNPTTHSINIGSGASYNLYVGYKRHAADGGSNFCGTDEPMTFVSTYVASGKYYLIANATSFYVAGVQVAADAYWDSSLYDDRIRSAQSGCLYLTLDCSDSASRIDSVGWTNNGGSSPPSDCTEGTAISLAGQGGLATANQLVRISSPLLVSDDYGKAYDSNNNLTDFLYPYAGFSGISYRPYTMSNSSQTVISGIPAVGASIAASDPYSGSAIATAAYVSSGTLSILYAPFSFVGVTTGTWNVVIASGSFYADVATVTVVQNSTTSIPNAATVNPWRVSNVYAVMMDTSSLNGFVRGLVTDVNNNKLSGIQVLAGGVTKTTGANGTYFASVASGTVIVIANPNNTDPAYVQVIAMPTVNTGQITDQDFILTKGGALQGYLTSGTSPLPNFVVTANISGSQYGSGTSNTSGYFTIRNLSTATYTVQPVLEAGQDSSPNTITATVSSTATVFIGTFTVSGAFGNIIGSVTVNGSILTSGSLVLASTAALASSPPPIVASSAPAQAPVYAVSSLADGTFELPVRGNSTYFLSVYVPVVATNGTTVTITTKTYSTIFVSPSADKTQNISVP
ncbi:MAG: carboxypeptidase regulatory-like domain-containing protein [Elusimicrobia bacterium]|nr:carboxypeptidase regulatory-like domain-containing protein [Elusimicrobiota bacterium]